MISRRHWLTGSALFLVGIFLFFTQNCGQVDMIDTTQYSVEKPIILAPMKMMEMQPNSTKEFELETLSGSAEIRSMAFNSHNSTYTYTTANLNQVTINKATGKIRIQARQGFQGLDKFEIYLFDENLKPVKTEMAFAVYNPLSALPEITALVYGAGDEAALAAKKIGGSGPGMADIFSNWSRFDSSRYYPKGTTPQGESASWQLVRNPDRVVCPVNSDYNTGFVSLTSFDYYTNQATLTSSAADDDIIMLIIAFTRVDGANHSLVAIRGRGDLLSLNGFGIFYIEDVPGKKWKATKYFDISVDGFNSDSTTPLKGWNNLKSTVRVERKGDIVEAYASNWRHKETDLVLDPASKLTLDLNAHPELHKFKGPKAYGYGSWSQQDATFLNVQFSTGLSDRYLYDLATGTLFEKNGSTYIKRSDIDAFSHIGFPRRANNPDTGKAYMIYPNKTYGLSIQ